MQNSKLLILGLLALSAFGADDGQFTITVDGQDQQVYLTSSSGDKQYITVNGKSFSMHGGGRCYISKSPGDTLTPDTYEGFSLLGKSVQYDVDLSNVPCSCNSAFYTSKMPGYDWNQNPDPTQGGDYYCDANKVGGEYCPEMDILESNKYTMAVTPHTCNAPNGKHYDWCDGAGCGQNIYYSNPNAMCPEDRCTINTQRAFTMKTSFKESNGQLSGISVELNQEGRNFQFDSCNRSDYLQTMGGQLDGMVFVASLWGNSYGTMSWLDGMTGCSGDCNLSAASATYSNVQVNSISSQETQ